MKRLFKYIVFAVSIGVLASCSEYNKLKLKRTEQNVANEYSDSLNRSEKITEIHYSNETNTGYYQRAFEKLTLLIDTISGQFKEAVFVVENAYNEDSLNWLAFDENVEQLFILSKLYKKAIDTSFIYPYSDRDFVLSHNAIFSIIKDTVVIKHENNVFFNYPSQYFFEDFDGKKEWSNTFVSNLLESKKGNCQSLSYLYKILCDEYGIETHLALAPNHIYITHSSIKTGYYNTELSDGSFPIDGWIMASGYIHLDAVRNGIYMNPLSNKESIALCFVDLAHGYRRKFGESVNSDFTLKCVEKALSAFSNCIPALLLKAKILGEEVQKRPNDLTIKQKYESLVIRIHKLGYRRMPESMYLSWLTKTKNRTRYEKNN